MKLAIMQPYFFPYIGYFQLVAAVDHFMFYDDVNFIKRGWINRTNIIKKDGKQLLTINLSQSSQNKKINEIELSNHQNKILLSIEYTYKKAPFFDSVFPLIEECINCPLNLISEFAANSIIKVSEFLDLNTKFSFSSEFHKTTVEYEKAKRLIDICYKENADIYINAIGGKNIYFKEDFRKKDIELFFIQPNSIKYNQEPLKTSGFEQNLSIIDVLMFNEKEAVLSLLSNYELV